MGEIMLEKDERDYEKELREKYEEFEYMYNPYINVNDPTWLFGIRQRDNLEVCDKYELFMYSSRFEHSVTICTSNYDGYIERYQVGNDIITINFGSITAEKYSECIIPSRMFRIFNRDNIDKNIKLLQITVPYAVYRKLVKKVCLFYHVDDIKDMKNWMKKVNYAKVS